jgi:DNA-directed RNA polymerase subunit K/omega
MSELKEMNDEDLFDKEEDYSESEESGGEEEEEVKDVDIGVADAESEDDAESDILDSDAEYDSDMEGGKMRKVGGAKKASEAEAEASEAEAEASEAEAEASEAEAEASEADEDEGDADASDDEDYLQKFNKSMRDDLILNFHPESKSHNYEEIKQLAKVTRNKNGIVVDELHKTIPLLTKYEKTRILGQRAKQIETGAIPLVQVPPNIIDSYLIAKLELAQNTIPFIIRRPLPNGGMEYWYVNDLENL